MLISSVGEQAYRPSICTDSCRSEIDVSEGVEDDIQGVEDVCRVFNRRSTVLRDSREGWAGP